MADNIVDGYGHKIRNNLGFNGGRETDKLDVLKCDVATNYFTLTITVIEADFVSLDESLLVLLQKADGSLPEIGFMKLTPNSKLIDKCENIGYKFAGKVPDLGAFEYKTSNK